MRIFNSYRKQLKILKQNLNKGNVVIDIGAREGQFTLLASKKVGLYGSVYAIEPERENFEKLEENTKNLVNVKRYKALVGLYSGWDTLHTGRGSYYNTAYKTEENKEYQNVPIMTLNEFMTEKVDMLIIDACGSEGKIIKGADKFIDNNPQLKIMMDFCPKRIKQAEDNPEELLSLLEEHNYKFYQIMGGLFKDLEERTKEDLLKDDTAKWLLIKK